MKKRLLFIPLHYNANPRPHEDWFNGLGKYYHCTYYESRMQVDSVQFDFILIQSGAIDCDTIRFINISSKVIQWTGDARADVMENVTQYKGIADLTLLAVGIGQKEMYEKAMGTPVDYLQQGVFSSFFIKPQKLESGKTVFIGNNYDHFPGAIEREQLCWELADGSHCDFETIGNGWTRSYNNTRSIPYIDSAKIYNESYISISHACFNDIDGYYSNRTIDIMAAGGCCLMRRFPGCENYFTELYDCMFYSTTEEAIEKINYLYERPDVRNEIAKNGYNKARLKHTFDVRAREVKELIEKHL